MLQSVIDTIFGPAGFVLIDIRSSSAVLRCIPNDTAGYVVNFTIDIIMFGAKERLEVALKNAWRNT